MIKLNSLFPSSTTLIKVVHYFYSKNQDSNLVKLLSKLNKIVVVKFSKACSDPTIFFVATSKTKDFQLFIISSYYYARFEEINFCYFISYHMSRN